MTPGELAFYDPALLPGFALHDGTGEQLIALRPTIGLSERLGAPDPYTWDRPPGSVAWFPLGDGLPGTRPTVTLGGEWIYNSPDEALTAIQNISTALQSARELWWCGVKVADLDPTYPGSYHWQFQGSVRHVQHTLVLNTTTALSAEQLALAIGHTGSPPMSGISDTTLARTLPYIWPGAGQPETYAAAVTLDLLTALGRAAQVGVVENLGEYEFEAVQWQTDLQLAPLTVLPNTSRELMAGVTRITLTPVAGQLMRPQLEVQ